MNHKTQLLSTALLDQSLKTKAEEQGMVLDCVPFIQVNTIEDIQLASEIAALCSRQLNTVFTSANAVTAISRHLQIAKPMWDVYCISGATRDALLVYFPSSALKGTANDAAGLATILLSDGVRDIVFFCGDKRMDTLPALLREQQVNIQEVIVYETIETPQMLGKEYDGILFYSPSGVNSFFSINKVKTGTVLFAIGNTTASALRAVSGNTVVVSDNPSKESMLSQAIQYFHKEAQVSL